LVDAARQMSLHFGAQPSVDPALLNLKMRNLFGDTRPMLTIAAVRRSPS
jgi:hypothetical protein